MRELPLVFFLPGAESASMKSVATPARQFRMAWSLALWAASALSLSCRHQAEGEATQHRVPALGWPTLDSLDSARFTRLLDSSFSDEARVLIKSEPGVFGRAGGATGDSPVFSLEIDFPVDWKAFQVFQVAFGEPFAPGGVPWRFGRAFLSGQRILVLGSESPISVESLALPEVYKGPVEPPAIFSWLLQSGKIPNSERVVWGSLWSRSSTLPVFTAQYRCQDERAWIFICPGGDVRRDFSELLEKMDHSQVTLPMGVIDLYMGEFLGFPLKFAHLAQGWAAIEGCHDSSGSRQKLMAQVEILPLGAASLFLKKNAISN